MVKEGVIVYPTTRSDDRIKFATRCIFEIGGVKYTCHVENISETGALIEVISISPNYIKLENIGTLKVLLLSPVNYRCKVARINENKIGLKFI